MVVCTYCIQISPSLTSLILIFTHSYIYIFFDFILATSVETHKIKVDTQVEVECVTQVKDDGLVENVEDAINSTLAPTPTPTPTPTPDNETLTSIKYRNWLNVTITAWVILTVGGPGFWPSGGRVATIPAHDYGFAQAAWSDGTYYTAKCEANGHEKESDPWPYHGLDIYCYYDPTVKYGFAVGVFDKPPCTDSPKISDSSSVDDEVSTTSSL